MLRGQILKEKSIPDVESEHPGRELGEPRYVRVYPAKYQEGPSDAVVNHGVSRHPEVRGLDPAPGNDGLPGLREVRFHSVERVRDLSVVSVPSEDVEKAFVAVKAHCVVGQSWRTAFEVPRTPLGGCGVEEPETIGLGLVVVGPAKYSQTPGDLGHGVAGKGRWDGCDVGDISIGWLALES